MATGLHRRCAAYPMVDMKKLIYILACLMPLVCMPSCVGQKDDPEDEPVDNPEEPQTPVDESEMGSCLVLDFTGTWCVNCPRMHTAIESAMEQRPGLIVPVAVHCLSLDPMMLAPVSDDLAKRFGVSAYPSVVVNFDPLTLFTAASTDLLLAHCDKSRAARGKAAALEIKPSEKGAEYVCVQATAARDGDYTLHLLRLEDGIVEPQTGAGEDYVHNDVLREWTEAPEAFSGRRAGDVFSADFKADLPAGSGKLVAIVCRGGIVDNVLSTN